MLKNSGLMSSVPDKDFLLAGDVFTPDLLQTWIDLKNDEIDALRQRPHPYEFDLYYQI